MGGVTKKLFGGVDKSAQKNQIKSNAESRGFTRQMLDQNRNDVLGLMPAGLAAGRQGFDSAIDLLSGLTPTQLGMMQGGNMQAQQSLLSGGDAAIAALLGQPAPGGGAMPPQGATAQAGLTAQTVDPRLEQLMALLRRPDYNASTAEAVGNVQRPQPQGGAQLPNSPLGGMFY
jgi:hypothetical protein